MMICLIPKIFFWTMEEGLDLFVAGLGFTVVHQEAHLAGVKREGARAYLVVSPDYAAKDRPEVAIETDGIEALWTEVSGRRPDLLHPNLAAVQARPWGAREFAVLDRTGVCVVFRQWG